MPEPATLLGSETRLMESQHTGRTYRITVSLPLGYSSSPGEGWPFNNMPAQWPVVYLIDANWFFGVVTDMVRSMAWCGGTSDAIIVGIGYPEDEDPQETWREVFARRNEDLTFARDEEREKRMGELTKRPVLTGDAVHFHKFIRDELIPLIEREYRADPSRRILAGHSLGGDFAVFALFEEPSLFETFIILSSGPRHDGLIFKQEEAFAKAHRNLAAKVYLSAGELEESADDTTLTDTLRFAAILESRNYVGFSLVKRIFPDTNHCEVVAPGFQAGLKFALRK